MFVLKEFQEKMIVLEYTPDQESAARRLLELTIPPKHRGILQNKTHRKFLTHTFLTGIKRLLENKYYKNKNTSPYVCLSMRPDYYVNRYTDKRPHLKTVFKATGANERAARYTKKVYEKSGMVTIEKGYMDLDKDLDTGKFYAKEGTGQLTRFYFHPLYKSVLPFSKDSDEYKEAESLFSEIILSLGYERGISFPENEEGITKYYTYAKNQKILTAKSTRYWAGIRKLIAAKNASLPEQFKTMGTAQVISNEDPLFGARIYSGFSLSKKLYRNAFIHKHGLVQDDLPSAVVNFSHLIHEQTEFDHPVVGKDIYLYMVYTLFGNEYTHDLGLHLRGLMKEFITVATGHRKCSEGEMLTSIIYHLEQNGFAYENPTAEKYVSQQVALCKLKKETPPPEAVLHQQYLNNKKELFYRAKKEQRLRYENYCATQKEVLQPKKVIPSVGAYDILNLLQNDRIISKMAFNDHYKTYFGSETIMNIGTIAYAQEKSIPLFTVHDELITTPENKDEIVSVRNQMMWYSAQIMNDIIYKFPQKAQQIKKTGTNKQKREEIKKTTRETIERQTNKEGKEAIAMCYTRAIRHHLCRLVFGKLGEESLE